jgi:hypothetical protein
MGSSLYKFGFSGMLLYEADLVMWWSLAAPVVDPAAAASDDDDDDLRAAAVEGSHTLA